MTQIPPVSTRRTLVVLRQFWSSQPARFSSPTSSSQLQPCGNLQSGVGAKHPVRSYQGSWGRPSPAIVSTACRKGLLTGTTNKPQRTFRSCVSRTTELGVFYSRTHDHGSMAVASDLVSTHFDMPATEHGLAARCGRQRHPSAPVAVTVDRRCRSDDLRDSHAPVESAEIRALIAFANVAH